MPVIHADHQGHLWLANDLKNHVYTLDAWRHFVAEHPDQRGAAPGHQQVVSGDIERVLTLIADVGRAVRPEPARSWTAMNKRRKRDKRHSAQSRSDLASFGQLRTSATVVLRKRAVLSFVGVPLGAIHPVIAHSARSSAQLLLCIDTQQGDILVAATHRTPRTLAACGDLLFAPAFEVLPLPSSASTGGLRAMTS
ncbi:MAG: hypothetical protein JRH20_14925 [Deltaproteobacteria bacterium]|nr:hypothetical protein [Deltaproteobacteria bacterium]